MESINPMDIEKRSMEIISQELAEKNVVLPPQHEAVIKRVIHTTADFDYADNLCFSDDAVESGLEALRNGAVIVTDTTMVKSGINKTITAELGGEVVCYIADEDVAQEAKSRNTTRSCVSMEKAAKLQRPCIVAIGNAPTALIRLDELIKEGAISPSLVIGVPVGFVNVVESKEIIMNSGVPFIVAKGRKGGSNVAASIINALLYQIRR